MRACTRLALLAVTLAGITSLHAAPITWTPATNTVGKSQLLEGNIVFAVSGGSGATITGGGAGGTSSYPFAEVSYQDLVFTPAPGLRTSADISNGAPSTGDANFDAVMKSFTDTRSGITGGTQTIGGLSAGVAYQIQVFFNDQRACCTGRTMTYGDGGANNANLAAAGGGWGQHAIGSFTADATTQALTHVSNGFGNVHVTAILVTQPGPPPAPHVPTNLVATAGDAEVTLDWDDNTQFGFANFIVRRATTAGGPYSDLPGATPSAGTYTDTGLTNGVTYYYAVSAKSILAQVSANSAETSATPMVFVPDPPEVPTGLIVTPGNNRNTLNWDENPQAGFLEFRVRRATTPGGPYLQLGTTGNSFLIDLTAANGITYYYVITTVNVALAESAPSAGEQGTPSPSAIPPNFLFIVTDDQDTYSVGAYRSSEPVEPGADGNPYFVATPNMDRLAAEGMLFHNAHLMGALGGAVCTFSRTMIMTGRSLWHRTVGSAANTFPGALNLAGYDTYRTCKNGNSYALANGEFDSRNDATKRGNTDGNGSEWHADNVLNFLDNRATTGDSDPFFIYLGFSHPHDTRNARTTPNLAGRYGCLNTTSPGTITLNSRAPPLPISHLPIDASLGVPANYPFHPYDHGHLNVRDEVNVPGILQYRTEPVVRNEIGRNFACVDWIDRQLGRVLAKLEEQGLMNNTYIVFTSDHGIAIGRHGLQGKQNLYEHTWKVPFIVRGPGIAAGSETDAMIYLHDVFPTFCDLAGATVTTPSTIGPNDGLSIRPVLEGTATTVRDAVYGVYRGGSRPGMRSIKNGRWKMIKYDLDGDNVQETQVFDLLENPFELLPEHGVPNLATLPSHALVRQELEELLMAKRREFEDPDAFLGDRTLLRFEDGTAGQVAGALTDRLPWQNDGTAFSGNGGTLPTFAADVPGAIDFVTGEPNTLSLAFEQDDQNYLQVADDRALDFGNAPFTIEAWVKLESLPTGPDAATRMPVVMKKAIGAGDANLDYMFLAAAGSYANEFANLALLLGSTTIVSSLSIPDTGWHHLSVAFDSLSDTVRFTLDDQVDIQATTASGTANNGPLVIGAHFNAAGVVDSAFDGLIDELSITDGFLELAALQPLQDLPTPEPFQVTSIAPNLEGTFDLSFESNENFLYDVERSSTLADGSWTTVRSFLGGAAGTATTTVTELPRSTGTRSFYRVVCYRPIRP
ncbi:MAG: sulfatase-like hydrolase/transferase [Roseibacillus sp.]